MIDHSKFEGHTKEITFEDSGWGTEPPLYEISTRTIWGFKKADAELYAAASALLDENKALREELEEAKEENKKLTLSLLTETTAKFQRVTPAAKAHDCEYQYRAEIDELKSKLAAAEKLSEERRAMLKKYQFVRDDWAQYRCPECHLTEQQHTKDCELARLVRKKNGEKAE